MTEFPRKLAEIAKQLDSGQTPERTTVRALLEWFGAQRRGFYVVQNIRSTLEKLNIRTTPDFESAYIDGLVAFSAANGPSEASVAQSNPTPSQGATLEAGSSTVLVSGAVADPTHRIGRLPSANNPPLAVKPDTSVNEAVTLMLAHDYSQLPVMPTEREVKGVISWASIGSRFALERPCSVVRECMEPSREIGDDTSLFAAIDTIVKYQYVLIRDSTRKVCGIVTPSDLSLQFLQLGEPFLLLGEIENHVRRLIQGRFSLAELREARDPNDASREVSDASDLTFGGYIALLAKPESWRKLGVAVDRAVFIERLERVRVIRNEVMHFDPDGPAPSDLQTLRDFVRFLQELRAIGVT